MANKVEKIGIIGGTGLYKVDDLEEVQKVQVHTPFGAPSAMLTTGKWMGREVVFLPRHGDHHEILPSEINFRANIWALKYLGARQIVSVSATGSLVQDIPPGELALARQYIDLTKGIRKQTFFGEGLVAHISSAEPACPTMSQKIQEAARDSKLKLHVEKTYICVEGPRLGTRAESFMLRGMNGHLVGMTNVPEVFLAREAQICYVTLAIPTDYDCWLDDPNEHVSLEQVMKRYAATLSNVLTVLRRFISSAEPSSQACSCRKALEQAILTPSAYWTSEHKKILEILKL